MSTPIIRRGSYALVAAVFVSLVFSSLAWGQFEIHRQAAVAPGQPSAEEQQRYRAMLSELARTGTVTRSVEERARIAAAREDRRSTLNASRPAPAPRVRSGSRPARTAVASKVDTTTVFVVNSAYDDPDTSLGDGVCDDGFTLDTAALLTECSLRAAIEEANLVGGTDSVIILIDILSQARGADITGPFGYDSNLDTWRIAINTNLSFSQGPLPPITRDNVHIDGTFQKDGSGVGTFDDAYCGDIWVDDTSRVKVMLDGIDLNNVDNVLNITGDDVTIKGVAISNAAGNGVNAAGANRLDLECVHVGTDHFGISAEPNLSHGVVFAGASRLDITRSIVSGNVDNGVISFGDSTYVRESFVGTDRKGTYAISNGALGIQLSGSLGLVQQVLASGNNTGVFLDGSNHLLTASGIGINRSGTSRIQNSTNGVTVFGDDNLIGGSSFAERSYISGNTWHGIEMADTAASNIVARAWIGLDVTGTDSLPNGISGVRDRGSSNIIGFGPSPEPPPIGAPTFAARPDEQLAKTGLAVEHETVISGNRFDGVSASGKTTVIDSYIGTNAMGTAAVPNLRHGVYLSEGGGHAIGGTVDGTGNLISGNGSSGIFFDVPTSTGTIEGNFIGTDVTGLSAIGNNTSGGAITIAGDSVFIGGSVFEAGNLVSGNVGDGIRIMGSANFVRRNYIGTDLTGGAALANGGDGVEVSGFGNFVGGSEAGNLISGNAGHGVRAEDPFVNVSANLIGSDFSGTSAVPNGLSGILLSGVGSTIGGSGTGNLISGNTNDGIEIVSPAAGIDEEDPTAGKSASLAGHVILGNFIGTDATTAGPLPNGRHGIWNASSVFAQVGSGGASNTMAFNTGAGVRVTGTGVTWVNNNSIFANGGLGIDLGTSGVTPNDIGPPHDTDSGPNGLQNFPVIVSANRTGPASADVTFNFSSAPLTGYTFEFSTNASPDSSGHGEGQTQAAFHVDTTDASGNLAFAGSLSGEFEVGDWLTVTATNNASLETSEFSGVVQITGTSVDLASGKVFLEGPFGAGTMSTNLLSGTHIPVNQPYGDALFNGRLQEYDPVVTASAFPANTVDWMVLSLRSSTTAVSEIIRRVAFVRNDGILLDVDGSTSVPFSGVAAGNYYLVVCHRNHLCAMSASAVDFTSGTGTWDFTTAMTQAYTTAGSPMKSLSGGVFGLFAGDNNADGIVTAPDFNQWNAETTAGATGYRRGDHNLDAIVTAPDFNLWNANTTAGAATRVP